jgi:hypothetical protein
LHGNSRLKYKSESKEGGEREPTCRLSSCRANGHSDLRVRDNAAVSNMVTLGKGMAVREAASAFDQSRRGAIRP